MECSSLPLGFFWVEGGERLARFHSRRKGGRGGGIIYFVCMCTCTFMYGTFAGGFFFGLVLHSSSSSDESLL